MDITKLKAILPHLRYEWRQLNDASELLKRYHNRRNELPRGAWSAYVESFVIHGRALMDMLYRGRKYSSDVDAVDFLEDHRAWERVVRSSIPKELDEVIRRVNKQVAHLTYDRTAFSPSEFIWDVERVLEWLRVPMKQLHEQTRREGKVSLLAECEEIGFLSSRSCRNPAIAAATTGAELAQ